MSVLSAARVLAVMAKEFTQLTRDRLDEVHSAIGPILRRMAVIELRLASYRPRLQEALDKFDEGESNWLASPLMDSYHTVWMQLHQQLILRCFC